MCLPVDCVDIQTGGMRSQNSFEISNLHSPLFVYVMQWLCYATCTNLVFLWRSETSEFSI